MKNHIAFFSHYEVVTEKFTSAPVKFLHFKTLYKFQLALVVIYLFLQLYPLSVSIFGIKIITRSI